MNGFTELVIILTNPEGKKKVTEEAKCNTLKKNCHCDKNNRTKFVKNNQSVSEKPFPQSASPTLTRALREQLQIPEQFF